MNVVIIGSEEFKEPHFEDGKAWAKENGHKIVDKTSDAVAYFALGNPVYKRFEAVWIPNYLALSKSDANQLVILNLLYQNNIKLFCRGVEDDIPATIRSLKSFHKNSTL